MTDVAELSGWWLPRTRFEDERAWADLTRDVMPARLFPSWPFVQRGGEARFCAWGDVMSGDFGSVLHSLCEAHGDTELIIATFSGGGVRELRGGGLLPIMRFDATRIDDDIYWRGIGSDPGPIYAIPLWPGAEIVAATGSTGGWSLWAEEQWEIGVVRTTADPGQAVDSVGDSMLMDVDTALDVYAAQALRSDGVPSEIRTAFRRTFA